MNLHIKQRSDLAFTRTSGDPPEASFTDESQHGESEWNVYGKIGGDGRPVPSSEAYALKLRSWSAIFRVCPSFPSEQVH